MAPACACALATPTLLATAWFRVSETKWPRARRKSRYIA
jgi:hypothetical protein